MDDAFASAALPLSEPDTHLTLHSVESDPAAELPPPAPADAADAESNNIMETAEADAAEPTHDADPREQERIIEALLFGADAPLSAAKLSDLIDELTPSAAVQRIASLNERYAAAGMSFRIEKIARGYQMMSLPAYQPWLSRLHKQGQETRLSAAALETLALVAYKQPAMRADLEAIRGVACGDQINRLREMGLVKIVGRAEVVGRPLLYGTTRKFLDVFGLADLKDLPPLEEFGLAAKTATKPVSEVAAARDEAPQNYGEDDGASSSSSEGAASESE